MANFELRRLGTATVIHTYDSEAAALAFVRDVVVFAGREAGKQFQLLRVDISGLAVVAEADALMDRALEDRVL